MHREHDDAIGDDDDEDDVGDDVGGFFLSPVRRQTCSAPDGQQPGKQRKKAPEAAIQRQK